MHSEAYRKSIAVKRGSHNPLPACSLTLYCSLPLQSSSLGFFSSTLYLFPSPFPPHCSYSLMCISTLVHFFCTASVLYLLPRPLLCSLFILTSHHFCLSPPFLDILFSSSGTCMLYMEQSRSWTFTSIFSPKKKKIVSNWQLGFYLIKAPNSLLYPSCSLLFCWATGRSVFLQTVLLWFLSSGLTAVMHCVCSASWVVLLSQGPALAFFC